MSNKASGTQSPPLEATGEHVLMGTSSVNSDKPTSKPLADSKQREQYHENAHANSDEVTQDEPRTQKLKGESLVQKLEERA